MKLRLKGNSIRLRLTRSEVTGLQERGLVEESANFAGQVFTYRIRRDAVQDLQAEFQNGTIVVTVPPETVQDWASSDEVGIYAQAGAVTVAIEKDFRCLTRPEGDQERDAYPHPAEAACSDH